jgi:hypothetical protein
MKSAPSGRIWLDLCPLPSFLSHLPLHRSQNLRSGCDWIYLILNYFCRQAALNFWREMEVIRQNGKEFGQVRLVQWLRVGGYARRYLATRPGPLHDVFPKAVAGKVCNGLNIAKTRAESRGPCTHLRLFTGDFIKMTLSELRSSIDVTASAVVPSALRG